MSPHVCMILGTTRITLESGKKMARAVLSKRHLRRGYEVGIGLREGMSYDAAMLMLSRAKRDSDAKMLERALSKKGIDNRAQM